MINSNRVTIIPADGAVYLDTWVYLDLDLSMCGIPEEVHALQWLNNQGHIEYIGHKVSNTIITDLPEWAINCVKEWEKAHIANPPVDESNPPA